jgi:hypothetical protein
MAMRTLFVIGLALVAGCQGAPKLGYDASRGTPGSHAEYGRFVVDVNANGRFMATGVDAGSNGIFERHFKAQTLSIEPDVSPYWSGISAQGGVYNQQMNTFGQVVLPAYSAGAVAILQQIPPIIQSATPLLGPYLNALGQARIASATRPGVVAQLAAAVAQGAIKTDLIESTFKAIDPTLAADVAKAAPVSVQSLQPVVGPN